MPSVLTDRVKAERERLRAERSVRVDVAGGKTTGDGFGLLDVSKATMHMRYDRTLLEHVILHLVDLGHDHVADAIRSCTQESMRPGTLPILRTLPEYSTRQRQPRAVCVAAPASHGGYAWNSMILARWGVNRHRPASARHL